MFLAKQGHHVTGVDSSAMGLKKAVALAEKEGVADKLQTEVADREFPLAIPPIWSSWSQACAVLRASPCSFALYALFVIYFQFGIASIASLVRCLTASSSLQQS